MFNKKTGAYLAVLFIVLVLVLSISIININNNITYAQGQKTLEEFFRPIGEFMQSNPDFLKDAVKTIKSAGVTSDETVAWVNGILMDSIMPSGF